MWDIARSNITDFRDAFDTDKEGGLSAEEREALDRELKNQAKEEDSSVGRRAGQEARRFRDKAEEAWDQAYDAAQQRAEQKGWVPPGAGTRTVDSKKQIEGWYKTLEVEPGTSMTEIRRSYRKLLAKYHPDRYAHDQAKYQAANDVVRRVTDAYNGLRRHLEGP